MTEPAGTPCRPCSSSPMAPASPPRRSVTASWRNSRSSSTGSSACRSWTRSTRPRRRCSASTRRACATVGGRLSSRRWSTPRSTANYARRMILDLFESFVEPLETELGMKSTHTIGRFHNATESEGYKHRIEAINFSLAHDDGQSARPAIGRRDPGRRFTQRQDADQPLSRHAVRHQGRQLSADPRRFRAQRTALRPASRSSTSCSDSRSRPSAWRRFATSAGPTAATPRSRTAATRSLPRSS